MIVLLIIADYHLTDYGNGGQVTGRALFGAEQARKYQEIFSTMEKRQKDNDVAASSTYPRIFKKLTDTKNGL